MSSATSPEMMWSTMLGRASFTLKTRSHGTPRLRR
jgi:hypothetical protein